MKPKFTINLLISWVKRWRQLWLLLQKFVGFLGLLLVGWLLVTTIALFSAAAQPVDALFVLGGSIRREIHVAKLAQQDPKMPILVSNGSPDPCIRRIFERDTADLQGVWLEKCANSTFENFYYGLPILQSWGVRKVKLITSPTHTPRATWMARIIFGAHRIWVEPDIVKEKGRPANQENWLKTVLDITRSLGWAIASQIIQPSCSNVTKLVDVNLATWEKVGYACEHQAGLKKLKTQNPKFKIQN